MVYFVGSKELVMSYVRKTRDEFLIVGDFGYGHGYEEVSAYDTRREAKEDIKEYRASGIGVYKIVKRRIKLDPSDYAPFPSWDALLERRREIELTRLAHENRPTPCRCSACKPYDLGNGWTSDYQHRCVFTGAYRLTIAQV